MLEAPGSWNATALASLPALRNLIGSTASDAWIQHYTENCFANPMMRGRPCPLQRGQWTPRNATRMEASGSRGFTRGSRSVSLPKSRHRVILGGTWGRSTGVPERGRLLSSAETPACRHQVRRRKRRRFRAALRRAAQRREDFAPDAQGAAQLRGSRQPRARSSPTSTVKGHRLVLTKPNVWANQLGR